MAQRNTLILKGNGSDNIVEDSTTYVAHWVQSVLEAYPSLSPPQVTDVKEFLTRSFLAALCRAWKKFYRCKTVFEREFEQWLRQEFLVVSDDANVSELPGNSEAAELPGPSTSAVKRGRPSKTFMSCGTRARRKKIREIQREMDPDLVRNAAETPKLSDDRACGILIGADLSKFQYEYMRLELKEYGVDLFPTYRRAAEVKKTTYPDKVDITNDGVTVDLQELLNHTASRLLLSRTLNVPETMNPELTLICKWGCDGSSGHSEYKQAFSNSAASDSSIFLTTLAPLRLVSKGSSETIYWQNQTPSSPRFCRPLRFKFEKETETVIIAELQRMEEAIKKLCDFRCDFQGSPISISFEMILSMIDGKILQIVNDAELLPVYTHSQTAQ